MRGPLIRFVVSCLWVSVVCDGSIAAGRGAAELSLDRSGISGLLAAALPDSIEVEIPGAGIVNVRIGVPDTPVLRDGGIETALTIEVDDPRLRLSIDVRFVPEIDKLYGHLQLVCEFAEPSTVGPLPLDLAALFEPLALPRRLSWTLDLGRGDELSANGFLQGVEIRDDRLVLLLGLELSRREQSVSARNR